MPVLPIVNVTYRQSTNLDKGVEMAPWHVDGKRFLVRWGGEYAN
jgi:hypothetical protein